MRLKRASSVFVERARSMRRASTAAEAHLWSCLRARQLHGLRFHRQRPIGSYIVDFYCPDARLVVELDGEYHKQAAQVLQDEIRTAYLE